jgi:hypothetical protein
MLRNPSSFAFAALAACVLVAGCDRPYVARDGTVSFQEKGGNGHGASVLTANGVEYRDNSEPPTAILRRSADEPWRAPIGFILPKDGRFTKTSAPTVLSTTGLAIVLRPSDTRVPSWGGEVLVRVDVIAPAAEGTARWGENVAIVLDGDGADAPALADAALAQLAGRDRVTILDARGARIIVPTMPASHRSMMIAALKNNMRPHTRAARDLPAALRAAGAAVTSPEVTQRVLLLTDEAMTPADTTEVQRLTQRGVQLGSVRTRGVDDLDERLEAVRTQIPQAGLTKFRDVRLTFEGTPDASSTCDGALGARRRRSLARQRSLRRITDRGPARDRSAVGPERAVQVHGHRPRRRPRLGRTA